MPATHAPTTCQLTRSGEACEHYFKDLFSQFYSDSLPRAVLFSAKLFLLCSAVRGLVSDLVFALIALFIVFGIFLLHLTGFQAMDIDGQGLTDLGGVGVAPGAAGPPHAHLYLHPAAMDAYLAGNRLSPYYGAPARSRLAAGLQLSRVCAARAALRRLTGAYGLKEGFGSARGAQTAPPARRPRLPPAARRPPPPLQPSHRCWASGCCTSSPFASSTGRGRSRVPGRLQRRSTRERRRGGRK